MLINGLKVEKKGDTWHVITPSGHDVWQTKNFDNASLIARNFIYRTSPFVISAKKSRKAPRP